MNHQLFPSHQKLYHQREATKIMKATGKFFATDGRQIHTAKIEDQISSV
jgi:hypothetical protein